MRELIHDRWVILSSYKYQDNIYVVFFFFFEFFDNIGLSINELVGFLLIYLCLYLLCYPSMDWSEFFLNLNYKFTNKKHWFVILKLGFMLMKVKCYACPRSLFVSFWDGWCWMETAAVVSSERINWDELMRIKWKLLKLNFGQYSWDLD